MKRNLWLALSAVLAIVVTACQGGAATPGTGGGGGGGGAAASPGGGGGGAAAGRGDIRIVVVTHGQATDPFWSVVKNGVDAGARDMGVRVEYQAPARFNPAEQAQLVDAAVATKPHGLVVSVPDPDALGPSIRRAVEAGIPVVTMNSGSDVYQELGALTHVGQTEYEAGFGGGERMAQAGVKNALCVNQEVGNEALDQRCKGFSDAMTKGGAKVTVVGVDLNDPTSVGNAVTAALQNDQGVDGVLTLGPTGATPVLSALQQGNLLGRIKLATFDLSPEVLTALDQDQMLFAIDQQQYLQGYLPIVFLTLYKQYGTAPGQSEFIRTGPSFVTKDNARQVLDLSRQGIR